MVVWCSLKYDFWNITAQHSLAGGCWLFSPSSSSYTHASANSTQTLRRGTMVITKITRQGVFNENLRRSLDKLVADKSDLHKEIEKTQWVLEKTRPRRLGPGFKLKPLGGVRIVNSSSESELDSITPDINTSFKPFNRKFKSRYMIKKSMI